MMLCFDRISQKHRGKHAIHACFSKSEKSVVADVDGMLFRFHA